MPNCVSILPNTTLLSLFSAGFILSVLLSPLAQADIGVDWEDLRQAAVMQNFMQSVGTGRKSSLFIDQRKPLLWDSRTYYWTWSSVRLNAKEIMCQLPIPAQFLQFDPTLGMPSEVAWACRHPETCCGLRCCKKTTTMVTSFRPWALPIFVVAVIVVSLGIYLLHRLEEKRAFIRESRRLAANKEAAKRPPAYTCYKTVYATLPHDTATAFRVYAEQARFLPPPPLPLSADVDHCHFAPAFNSDFRAELDAGGIFFRGGAGYVRPVGVFRYALAVVGKYPGQDEWLRRDGGAGEWQVAYHGTTCENISSIIRFGFDIERCQRFTYGKGIYCSPDPRVARNYSKPYESQGRWYKAVLQVRVHPTIKRIAYNEDGHEYWVIPASQAIRPYGVCVYDVTRY